MIVTTHKWRHLLSFPPFDICMITKHMHGMATGDRTTAGIKLVWPDGDPEVLFGPSRLMQGTGNLGKIGSIINRWSRYASTEKVVPIAEFPVRMRRGCAAERWLITPCSCSRRAGVSAWLESSHNQIISHVGGASASRDAAVVFRQRLHYQALSLRKIKSAPCPLSCITNQYATRLS